jgi:hypothetical protein
VSRLGAVTEVWVPTPPGFDAAVDVCVPFVRVGVESDGADWTGHLAEAAGVPRVALDGAARLGDQATTTAGFRSEYYGVVPHVHEESDCPSGRPIVTAGLVDLGGLAWGERPCRIGRRSWARPVVDVDRLEGRAAEWVARTGGPKLVVATQTKVLEVAVDEAGRFVAGVPLVVVRAPVDRLWSLASALAAPAVAAWLHRRVAGAAMAPGALKVSAALLREVPLPSDRRAWSRGTDAFRSGDLDGFAESMSAAYDVEPEVAEWWTPHARSVWSRARASR